MNKELEINRQKLKLFSESIGWKFRVVSGLEDIIEGVNSDLMLVKSANYGEFHVSICELIKAPAKKPSSQVLPEVLKSRNVNGRYDELIKRCESFYYDDFKFMEKFPDVDFLCPKMQLAADLLVYPELSDIRDDVVKGIYDDEADDEDNAIMKKELLEDGFSEAFIKESFGI